MNNKLKLIKFKHGEEVIVEVIGENDSSMTIANGAMLAPTENFQWHLMTWMPYTKAKDGLYLNKSDLLFYVDLSDDMVEYYFNWREALKKKINTKAD